MFELILGGAALAFMTATAVLLSLLSRRKLEVAGLRTTLESAELRHKAEVERLRQALQEARRPVVVAAAPKPPPPVAWRSADGTQEKRVLVELTASGTTPWRALIDRLDAVGRMLNQAAAADDLRGLQGWNGQAEVGFVFGVAGREPYPTLPALRAGGMGVTRNETAAVRALLPIEEAVRKARLMALQRHYLGGGFKQLRALREAAEVLYRLGDVPGLDQRALLRTLEGADVYLCKFIELLEPDATGESVPDFDPESGLVPAPGALPLDELYQRLDGRPTGACPNSPLAMSGDGAPPRTWRVDADQALPDGGHPLEPVYGGAPAAMPAAASAEARQAAPAA